eukprot:2444437-Pyramimonas_sp.AAC.1
MTGWIKDAPWIQKSIIAEFPNAPGCDKLSREVYDAGSGQYDLLVVEGMSQHSTSERILMIANMGHQIKNILQYWVPDQLRQRSWIAKMGSTELLAEQTARWIEEGIQRQIELKVQRELD